jgi:GntR family transcriptional regulator, transcriptional repressor for pyruvate dehydrogenase complex
MAARTVQVFTSVAKAIKGRIASGEWVVGQRLPSISQLAQEFGVGIGSIREAVKVLSSQGIVRIEHGRGMFVSSALPLPGDPYKHFQDIGTGSILALCEARRILEPELAAFAAERGTDDDLRAIREQALVMEQLVAAGEDFFEPDVQFHRQVALAAHNPVLARMMDGVNDLLVESRKFTSHLPDMTRRAVRYHLLIAEAIDERNPIQARLLMLAHVNDAVNSVLVWQAGEQQVQPPSASASANPLVLPQRSLTRERGMGDGG